MAILKNKLSKDFTMIPNWIISDERISNNAFRLLVYLYSRPTNWNVNQVNIAKEFDVGRSTVNVWISELKSVGAIEVIRRGRNYEYHLKIDSVLVSDILVSKISNVSEAGVQNGEHLNNTDITNTEKKNNNTDIYFSNPQVNDVFEEFLLMRKEMRKKATPAAIKKLISKLEPYNDEIKIMAINRSIECNYQGIFPESIKKSGHRKRIDNLLEG